MTKKAAALTPTRDGRGSRKRNRCLQCGVTLKGKRPDAEYCGHRCRQAAYRKRHARTDLGAALLHCAHCGDGFFVEGRVSRARKYCSASCRTLASRTRHEATIAAFADWQGIDNWQAVKAVEIGGLPRAAKALEANGFSYDQAGRCWRMAATLPALVRA